MGKQRPEMHHKRDDGTAGQQERRLDLSVPQVAGSALAAVAAAVLASRLGVYGTILGAGLVSVVATCGGSLFQHLFRRTGEQIRDVTQQARPNGTRLSAGSPEPEPPASGGPPGRGEFGEATTHGTRVRRRPALAAAVVFVVAMLGITAYELASGQDLAGGRGTTVGTAVRGGGGDPAGSDAPAPSAPRHDGSGEGHRGGDRGTGSGKDGGSSGGRDGDGTGGDRRPDSGSGSGTGPGADGGDGDRPAPGSSESADEQSPAAPQDPTPSAPSAPVPSASTGGPAPDGP
ncbi:hypothetical protein [Streptomyces wuyuanensis]|uniref:hypothetical protein n=1 Tax=Streptomyces wuyuanensis TaxID=1196353 RepID=UPI003794E7CB